MEIDIAIDLGGHTGLSRLQIFSHRPAPVQASWLGFPGTTGASFIDYFIADAVVAPLVGPALLQRKAGAASRQPFPNRSGAADRTATCPCRRRLAGAGLRLLLLQQWLEDHASRFRHLDAAAGRCPGKRAVAEIAATAETRANLEEEAAARGIDPARLVFAAAMRRWRRIWRGTGWRTCSWTPCPTMRMPPPADALWAGLPVLTCQGKALPAVCAASLLDGGWTAGTGDRKILPITKRWR